MFIIKYRNIFIGISVILMVSSVLSVIIFGIRPGIDFTGGSLIEVEYAENGPGTVSLSVDGSGQIRPAAVSSTTASTASSTETASHLRPDISEVREAVQGVSTSTVDALIQPTGDIGYIIRSKHLSEEDHAKTLSALSLHDKWQVTEKRFNTIGPVIGEELRNKAWVAIAAVMLAIVLFIAFVFRKVSFPVPSWQYGIITLIALLHDVLVPAGAIALLGKTMGAEADALFVTALLTVLGFSVHDTIVVFDRVRENLKLRISDDFSETVGKSLRQTFVRSVNTSLTVVIVLATILALGPESVHLFSLILLIGIIAGTYSSIFLASPLLVLAEKLQKKK